MASDSKRAELISEITKLQKQQLEIVSAATFDGWTIDQEFSYWRHS